MDITTGYGIRVRRIAGTVYLVLRPIIESKRSPDSDVFLPITGDVAKPAEIVQVLRTFANDAIKAYADDVNEAVGLLDLEDDGTGGPLGKAGPV